MVPGLILRAVFCSALAHLSRPAQRADAVNPIGPVGEISAGGKKIEKIIEDRNISQVCGYNYGKLSGATEKLAPGRSRPGLDPEQRCNLRGAGRVETSKSSPSGDCQPEA